MITDAEQHHKVGVCRVREAVPCKDCGLLKLKGVEHKCSVRLALQQPGAFYNLVKAREKSGEESLYSSKTIS